MSSGTAHESEISAIIDSPVADLFETGDGGGDINLPFYAPGYPMGWHSPNTLKMKATTNGSPEGWDEEITYSTTPDYDLLSNIRMWVKTPRLKIKDEYVDTYRMAWTPDLGYHIPGEVILTACNTEISHTDTVSMLDSLQFHREPETLSSRNRDLGNVPEMVNFSHILPQYNIRPKIPMFYSRSKVSALELYRFSVNEITHTIRYKLSIDKLLRMEKLVGDKWVKIVPDLSVVDGLQNNSKLPTPTINGLYFKLRDNELTWRTDETCRPIPAYIIVEDMLKFDAGNTASYGTSADSKLFGVGVCNAIYCKARNESAIDLNNLSNFTSSSDSILDEGYDPIATNTLALGSGYKFKDLESEHFNGSLSEDPFISTPTRPGYHAFAFSAENAEIGVDCGVIQSILKSMSCKLRDPIEYMYGEKSSAEDLQTKFTLVCRCQVWKRMYIQGGKVYFDSEV